MDINTFVLLLKSLLPALKELVLGKHTLKEALMENVMASILLAAMIIMLIVIIHLDNQAKTRYKEIQDLKSKITLLESDYIPPMPIEAICPEPVIEDSGVTVIPIIEEPIIAPIPGFPQRDKEVPEEKPFILRERALNKLKAIER